MHCFSNYRLGPNFWWVPQSLNLAVIFAVYRLGNNYYSKDNKDRNTIKLHYVYDLRQHVHLPEIKFRCKLKKVVLSLLTSNFRYTCKALGQGNFRYTCKIKNNFAVWEAVVGCLSSSYGLMLFSFYFLAETQLPSGFPTIDMGPQLKVVEKARTATMLCAASGNPDPEISWFKDFLPVDTATSNGRIKQLRSGKTVKAFFSFLGIQ